MNAHAAMVRVVLVDDHAVVRAGYRRLLQDEGDVCIVSEHGTADQAYAWLSAQAEGQPPADVLVLDLSMPGRSGLDLLHRLALRWPTLQVLVFSMHDSPAMVAQALKAGAAGYVSKGSEPALLIDAVRRVAAGERAVMSPDIAIALGPAATAAPMPHQAMSTREFEVLRLLVQGRTLDEIGQHLFLSPKTISNYQSSIRQRLGAGTAVEVMRYAQKHRLFGP
jgi:DNA-binding NarL/FixJ family response regulator